MLAYLISRKHVPTKKGTMYFGTWIDVNGDYFDTAHFPDSLKQYDFQGADVICFWEPWKSIFIFQPLPFIKWQRCLCFLIPVMHMIKKNNTISTGRLRKM
ncbi:hypothetical protein CHFL109739_20135 [Chryseobacterium flavum]